MNKILKTADTFVGGVLLAQCVPSFFILIAIIGIFRPCMVYDDFNYDSADVRLLNIFVYSSECEKLCRTHIMMTSSAYFSSNGKARHYIETFDTEVMLYVRNIGGYHIKAE